MSRTNYSAYMAIKKELLEIFTKEEFKNNKLPPETKLAARLGISLVTLREALLMLALEGYITKRHGSGNYIHPSTLNYENRSFYFADCLKNDGYKTAIKLLNQEMLEATEEVGKALGLWPRDTVLHNRILYLADGKPAIVTDGYLPVKLLVNDNIKQMRFDHVHEWIQEYLHRELTHSLNEYIPHGLDEEMAEIAKMPVGTPIIASKQTFYDIQDVPVLYNNHYIFPGLYRVKTLQNWDLGV